MTNTAAYCQFCDHEILIEAGIVYVRNYITCGRQKCQKAAAQAAERLVQSYLESQPEKGEATGNFIVWRCDGDPDIDPWHLTLPEEHPEMLKEPSIVAVMIDGNLAKPPGEKAWYRLQRTSEYLRGLNAQSAITH